MSTEMIDSRPEIPCPYGPQPNESGTIEIPKHGPRAIEGQIYAVWMPHGGFARVVIAHVHSSRHKIRSMLTYGFGPILSTIAEVHKIGIDDLRPENANFINIGAELGVRIGRWQLLGSIPEYSAKVWPFPCLSSDQPWQYVVMPPDPDRYFCGDIQRRLRVPVETASQFPETGLGTVTYTEWVLEAAIEGGWKGRRPFKGGPILPMCLDPWEVVVEKFGLRR